MRMYPGLLANAVRSALRSKHDLVLENLAVGHENSIRPRSDAEPASSDRSDLVLPSHGVELTASARSAGDALAAALRPTGQDVEFWEGP